MMFRAIVIDDEIWALRGFMNLLDWEKLEIQIIGGYQDEEEALEAIRRERPDIVVTDVYLKKRRGNEILRILQEEAIPAETVLISAHRDFEAAQDSLRYHTHAYILKPYRKEEVAEVFKALTEKMKQVRLERNEIIPPEGHRCFAYYTEGDIPEQISEWVTKQKNQADGGCLYELTLPRGEALPARLTPTDMIGLSMERTDFSDRKSMEQEAKFSNWYRFRFCEDPSIALVEKYIAEHISEAVSLNDIAEHFFMSSAYLSFKFRKATDTTVTDFIHQVKIEGAKRLLRKHVKLSDAAVMTGFSSYNYFGRLFKRYTGQSPEQYIEALG